VDTLDRLCGLFLGRLGNGLSSLGSHRDGSAGKIGGTDQDGSM
jgi:hypothetical protein